MVVYSSISQLVPALEPLAPGKTVIALAAVALAWSCGLCDRPFRLGLAAAGGTALYMFFAWVIASPAWSLWPRLSLEAAAESCKYLAAFVVAANVLDSRERVRRAATVLALASLFPAIGAIHSKLAGVRLVEGTRAAWLGVFENPNFLAFHLVVSTPIALALRDEIPLATPRREIRRAAWLLVVATFVVAIFLTESRGGTLGLGAVLLLWLARGLARGRLAIGVALAIAIAILMTPGGPWDRADTQATLAGQVDASAQGRIDAWRTALRITQALPMTGVGAGAFVLGYDQHAPGDSGPARTAHNSFLMIAAELGLPGLLFFGSAIFGAMSALSHAARRNGRGHLEHGAQAALFGYIACSLTGGYAFSWPLYFMLGLAAAMAAGPSTSVARGGLR